MNFKEVQDLIKLINKSNLTEFKMEKEDFKISIRTKKYGRGRSQAPAPQLVPISTQQMPVQMASPAPAPAAAPPKSAASEAPKAEAEEDTSNLVEVKSPIVGTFYRSSSPDKDAYVKVGDVIEKGSVVCIVEAMKLFNEIESEVSGRIVKVLLDNAQPVQYDQPLFLVDPAG
ncbi:MAG: acetyl-CoA carboxylase biotin carboxyl carrier protein [Saprospiraceae bacterium]